MYYLTDTSRFTTKESRLQSNSFKSLACLRTPSIAKSYSVESLWGLLTNLFTHLNQFSTSETIVEIQILIAEELGAPALSCSVSSSTKQRHVNCLSFVLADGRLSTVYRVI